MRLISRTASAAPARRTRLASVGLTALTTLSALLGGCSQMPSLGSLPTVAGDKVLGLVRPYRVEVVQGNVLTTELVARIKPGMHRNQVRDLLGSPMLTDVFHAERWDYVFTIRRQGAEPQRRQVIAWFDGDQLKSLETPADLPSEKEFIAGINTFKPKGDAPKLELSEAERKALPPPAKPEAAVAEPVGPVRGYPPLESNT
ncbi:outer membrane protein assembly factor BamE [Paucibacter sp. APW11]|uniref:Outer membrane protein assembly factor BamE n=1 Tax=Roseateles aquae TaxID=3077235 RepID=A0ABU3PA41_9BURK|nr:outer membrane protein assembly factor BamE [Paucibacter sp. APW11]MDT8999456.1 outer membrane protein assembly factor BamE [Paucibacter sp. APW11]